MGVLEVIQRSADFLAKKGVESPRLQVELLLAHLLKMPRLKLYLNFERVLTEPELNQLRELVKRRGNREPLQHLLGTTSFCGLELAVNDKVLIPRPETEILAERAWKFLNEFSTLNAQPTTALDFATGSGCLAIALATNCPKTQIYALDISGDALIVADENAVRNNVSKKIKFCESDGFSELPKGIKFNLIVANPPYISTAEIETLEPEVRNYDPRIALDGGADGLNFYRKLANDSRDFLLAQGRLMLEFGEGQGKIIREIFEEKNWRIEAIEKDYSQRERFLIAHCSD
ncbi:MAG: peptide chain release factor N(5)-glutamine methyltransferase [Verrucomicrobiota bacterium]|nr:peptide chain release factor N(5)-glutamine methyltransferase [Verrucomicrobiota bacterium]